MWSISSVKVNSKQAVSYYVCDGFPLEKVRGGEKQEGQESGQRLMINGLGYIDIEDISSQPDAMGELVLKLNGLSYRYHEQANIQFEIELDGTFIATGQDNHVSGKLHAIPAVTPEVLALFDEMMEHKIVPYQNPPSGTTKSIEQLQQLAEQYYPGDANGFNYAMCLYDWTSPSFIRMDAFNQFAYSGIADLPLDLDSMAKTIWQCCYTDCTARDADFMNMFMMKPATSEQDVRQQLGTVADQVQQYALAETTLQINALIRLPKVSSSEYPQLYRGGMAISGNTLDNFAPSLVEFAGNAGPTSEPLIYPFKDALGNMLQPGSIITLKTPWSFSNDLEGAKVWQRGVLVTCKPPEGYDVWPGGADITAFSLNPDTFEVNFPPNTRLEIESYEWITIQGKPVCHFIMRMLGYFGGN
ncbi:hypothetical protein MACH09_24780 [Vibrio sp. MACH09]|nr:hypothetical protein [Vibrio sp. MACH09]GLO61970.1 hypothetical protein MACH09_24780 [Vibrio sp. MACH09]